MRRLFLHRRRLTLAPLRIAVYVSGHGYGHCVRTGEVFSRLADITPISLVVTGDLDAGLWPRGLASVTQWRRRTIDVGVVQSDVLSVDASATALALDEWQPGWDRLVVSEAEVLRGHFDLVFGDVPPLAFAAAAEAGIASVAMANFSWDWIYRELGFDAHADAAAIAYAQAGTLFSLDPAAPMEAFPERESVGVLGRSGARDRHGLRRDLGVRLEERLVLIGLRAADPGVLRLPPPEFGIRYLIPGGAEVAGGRGDIIDAPAIWPWPDLVAAADVVLSKPGYGTLGDCAACGTPLLWVRRLGFPEDRVLEAWLEANAWAHRVDADALVAGQWLGFLDEVFALPRPDPMQVPAARLVAERIANCR